jgi:hypothetical protein
MRARPSVRGAALQRDSFAASTVRAPARRSSRTRSTAPTDLPRQGPATAAASASGPPGAAGPAAAYRRAAAPLRSAPRWIASRCAGFTRPRAGGRATTGCPADHLALTHEPPAARASRCRSAPRAGSRPCR